MRYLMLIIVVGLAGCGNGTTKRDFACKPVQDGGGCLSLAEADAIALATMRGGQGAPPFAVISSLGDDTILDTLDTVRDQYDMVFVDLEGVAGLVASYAAAASDMCLLPMRPSALDADATLSALKMISDTGRAARRAIPSRVILTQTSAALVTTSHREIRSELDKGISYLRTELIQRAAYERMIAEGKTLFEMSPSRGVLRAIENAHQLAEELSTIIKQQEKTHVA